MGKLVKNRKRRFLGLIGVLVLDFLYLFFTNKIHWFLELNLVEIKKMFFDSTPTLFSWINLTVLGGMITVFVVPGIEKKMLNILDVVVSYLRQIFRTQEKISADIERGNELTERIYESVTTLNDNFLQIEKISKSQNISKKDVLIENRKIEKSIKRISIVNFDSNLQNDIDKAIEEFRYLDVISALDMFQDKNKGRITSDILAKFHYYRAHSYAALQDYNNAKIEIEAGLILDKLNPELIYTYANVLVGNKEYKKAKKYLKKTLQLYLDKSTKDNLRIADIYESLGDLTGGLVRKLIIDQLHSDVGFGFERWTVIIKKFVGMSLFLILGVVARYRMIKYYRQALNIRLEETDTSYDDIIKSYLDIGNAYIFGYKKNKYYDKALEIVLKNFTSNNIVTADVYLATGLSRVRFVLWLSSIFINLNFVQKFNKNKYSDAITYCEKSIEIYIKVFGKKDRKVVAVGFELARLFLFNGDLDDSMVLLDEIANIHMQYFSDNEDLTKLLYALYNIQQLIRKNETVDYETFKEKFTPKKTDKEFLENEKPVRISEKVILQKGTYLVAGFVPDDDYIVFEKNTSGNYGVKLTVGGIEKIRGLFKLNSTLDIDERIQNYIKIMIIANIFYTRDINYIVRDGKIIPLDKNGQQNSEYEFDSVMQLAIEYKEGIHIINGELLENVNNIEKNTYCKINEELSDKQNEEVRLIGRNDPCPCGSGKKYKKCCGK